MRKAKTRETVARVYAELLSAHFRVLSLSEARAELDRLRPRERQRLLQASAAALDRPALCLNDDVRVCAAKVLLCLFPGTERRVRALLECRSDRSAFEVHFSLFCLSGDQEYLSRNREFACFISDLASEYLRSIDRETALAAWEAGQMLGRYVPAEIAFAKLLEAARDSRFAAGRAAAAQALADVAKRRGGSSSKLATRELRRIAGYDRAGSVRAAARVALRMLSRRREPRGA